MLYFLLNSELGSMGLIGYYFNKSGTSVPLLLSLALVFVYVFIPYLLGSINSAIIVSKKMYKDDVRNHGSGNAGFTNMMRTYGKSAAIITFAGDILKTVVSILVGWCVFGYLTAYVAGAASFIGHLYPVYYGFRGGKGVLSAATMILMVDWRIFLILLVIFVFLVAISKYISLGSTVCAMMFPILLNRMNYTGIHMIEFVAMFIGIVIVIKHRENLKRILNGTESKFKFKKSKEVKTDAEQ
ncbi:MAG: glycerol-3-phosphate 1-O-acyltransferase PlsY [Clostridia bacterium]|nr:glycerol-3-phosphate 1-O-acyltransferase PlsY [Clostridia bacterium]